MYLDEYRETKWGEGEHEAAPFKINLYLSLVKSSRQVDAA